MPALVHLTAWVLQEVAQVAHQKIQINLQLALAFGDGEVTVASLVCERRQ